MARTSLLLSFFSGKRVWFPGGMKWFKQSCCKSSAVLLCVCQELSWWKGTAQGEVKDVAVHSWVRCCAGYPCWLPARGIDSMGSPEVCLCQLLCDPRFFFSGGLCAPSFLPSWMNISTVLLTFTLAGRELNYSCSLSSHGWAQSFPHFFQKPCRLNLPHLRPRSTAKSLLVKLSMSSFVPRGAGIPSRPVWLSGLASRSQEAESQCCV